MRNTLQLKINCNFTYSLRNKYSTCYIYMISQLQRTSFICQLRLQCSCILNTSLDVAVKFWLWVKQITLYNVDRSHSISWKEWGALKKSQFHLQTAFRLELQHLPFWWSPVCTLTPDNFAFASLHILWTSSLKCLYVYIHTSYWFCFSEELWLIHKCSCIYAQ